VPAIVLGGWLSLVFWPLAAVCGLGAVLLCMLGLADSVKDSPSRPSRSLEPSLPPPPPEPENREPENPDRDEAYAELLADAKRRSIQAEAQRRSGLRKA
jgi:hypothetical protein